MPHDRCGGKALYHSRCTGVYVCELHSRMFGNTRGLVCALGLTVYSFSDCGFYPVGM